MYADEFATMGSSKEEEYKEIQSNFEEMLPGCQFTFYRDKTPFHLKNASPDVYVFDIGGLCYVDHSGERRLDLCREVLRQAEDHPRTLFVPWTSMTGDYLRTALHQLLPEWSDPDATLPENPAPFNVWLPPQRQQFEWWTKPGLADKLRSWKE